MRTVNVLLFLLFVSLIISVAAKTDKKKHEKKHRKEDPAEIEYVVKAIKRADKYAEKKGLSKKETKELEKNAAKKAIKKYAELQSKNTSNKKNREHYAWLKNVVRKMEDNINKEQTSPKVRKMRKFAAKKEMMKLGGLNKSVYDSLQKAEQGTTQNGIKQSNASNVMNANAAANAASTTYPIYKEDLSWSGYFWSFFGYPTRIQLDPTNELTMYLIQQSNREVVADPQLGLYVRITDKKKK